MAHPYGTQEDLENEVGPGLSDAVLARVTAEGGDVADIYAHIREKADARIDARTNNRYGVPYDPVASPWISTISTTLAAAYLFEYLNATGDDRYEQKLKQAEAWLEEIRQSVTDVPGATLVGATAAAIGFAYQAGEPRFGYDEDGGDLMDDF